MHIPDGFLNVPVLVTANGISLGVLLHSVRRINKNLSPRRIPLMGLSAAFVFTVQLLSFPVIGGTSVHITGALLISVLLGPLTGFVIISSALMLQAILFQHGGILTLGANIMNMGVTGCIIGYSIYSLLGKNLYYGSAFAAFITSILAAAFCALELGFSGTVPLRTGLFAMGAAHTFEGIVEALVTVSVLGIIHKARPDLLRLERI
jgi:cobalt/nickel transport system permease protein